MTDYQNRAKQIFRKLNVGSAPQLSVEHNNMMFHYQIDKVKLKEIASINKKIFQGVCYLCLADKNFSRKLAFSYLQDLQSEFFVQYGNRIDKVSRPYHFMNGIRIFNINFQIKLFKVIAIIPLKVSSTPIFKKRKKVSWTRGTTRL